MNNALDPNIVDIVKALAFTENGGAPNIDNPSAGASGETKSIFQFMPDTWKQYSQQAAGKVLPLNAENEATVVYSKVANWEKQGYTPEQIASMWNAGEQNPDAYKQSYKGTNKEGVAFNTPVYVKKFTNYLKQFEGSTGNSQTTPTQNPPSQGGQLATNQGNPGLLGSQSTPSQSQTGLLPPQVKQAKQAKQVYS